ncbi:MAG: hypothetical protein HY852_17025 [Bradyrhizobium sp.]|uniref:hypothetical protein n=1 Tax=Bradyrhizobium sp. TaxID=376 RepID=UPI0025BC6E0B|nr:hypothetical protein [Bradyrhizobium sp.]MBI5263515.1 hypothetical protein [Bradyrhizobium sp.]
MALNKSQLKAQLQTSAAEIGLGLTEDGEDGLEGENEAIKAKWFLGGRKLVYRMSLRLVEAEHAVVFREAATETSWGLPPPTLTVEVETVSGWKRSGARKDISPGGGGEIDYARVRDRLEKSTTGAGWQFRLEGGRLP